MSDQLWHCVAHNQKTEHSCPVETKKTQWEKTTLQTAKESLASQGVCIVENTLPNSLDLLLLLIPI
jgi:hypothetical protein